MRLLIVYQYFKIFVGDVVLFSFLVHWLLCTCLVCDSVQCDQSAAGTVWPTRGRWAHTTGTLHAACVPSHHVLMCLCSVSDHHSSSAADSIGLSSQNLTRVGWGRALTVFLADLIPPQGGGSDACNFLSRVDLWSLKDNSKPRPLHTFNRQPRSDHVDPN